MDILSTDKQPVKPQGDKVYKILRATALDPATALNDLEDAVNMYIANGWFPVGSHTVTPDERYSKTTLKIHYLATQAVSNSLTILQRLTPQ